MSRQDGRLCPDVVIAIQEPVVNTEPSRRDWLAAASATVGAGLLTAAATAEDPPAKAMFIYCLNTSTIRGQNLTISQEVEIAGRAGYQAIEPWLRELDQFVKDGGSLKDLGKRIRDAGLTVESAIGFAEWIVDDDARRKKGLEQMKRDMDTVQQIGGKRIAAPPVGAHKDAGPVNLLDAASRYRAVLELGDEMGVVPQVEVWGFSKNLSRLGEAALVAIESGHPKACILADVYHLYKGGSDFGGIHLLNGASMHVLHMNDYPDKPPRADITDAHRVYPGDGVAPIKTLLRDLRSIGYRGALSLELFNADYYKQDALVVARTGLEKMKAVAEAH